MPLYSSHTLRYEELQLGERIRQVRQRKAMTLKQVAEALDTSPARLSQIENGRLRLDVQDVLKFVEVLDVPLDQLIPADVTLPYQLTREGDVRTRPARPTLYADLNGNGSLVSQHDYRPLAELFVGRHLEPVLGRISYVDESQMQFCYHHEEEFTFVLRGGLEFRIKTPEGERREELGRGDCLYFRSQLPHSFRALDRDVPAETLHVFCAPSASVQGGFDGAGAYGAIAFRGHEGSAALQQQLGEKLSLLRRTHGWSSERLAESVGLSERQVLRIERGDRPMPLDAALRLARALGKPLRELIGLADGPGPYYFVQRSKHIPVIPTRKRRTRVERPNAPASKTCQPLYGTFPAREMYPLFLRMLNADIETLTLHEHHGQEFIYVLEGELEFTTYAGDQEVREVLRAGDACYLDSTVPHLLRSWTRNPYSETSAEVIDVFWCPLGESYLFEPEG